MTEHGVVGAGNPSALQLGNRPKPAAGRRPADVVVDSSGPPRAAKSSRWRSRSRRAPHTPQPCNRQEPAAGRRPVECRRWCCWSRRAPRAQQQCNQPGPAAGLRPVECSRWCSRSRRAPKTQQLSNRQEPAAGLRRLMTNFSPFSDFFVFRLFENP